MDYAAARAAMVENQLRVNQITDPLLIAAMAELPRERFAPGPLRGIAYVDEDLPLGNGRSMIEPLVLARLLQAADVQDNDRALVIGDPTGYAGAVLARICADVLVVEADPAFVSVAQATIADLDLAGVRIRQGALTSGAPDDAPFDVIVFGGAVTAVPEAVLDQLEEGGRLVAVIGSGATMGRGTVYSRASGVVSRNPVFDAATSLLPGFEPAQSFVF